MVNLFVSVMTLTPYKLIVCQPYLWLGWTSGRQCLIVDHYADRQIHQHGGSGVF